MSIAISTAIAAKSANTGPSSTKAPIMDNCANSRRLKADFGLSAEAVSEPALCGDTGAELRPSSPRTGAGAPSAGNEEPA